MTVERATCDLCGTPDPATAGCGWLAVMVVVEETPHAVGFALCDKCKRRPLTDLETLARARWAQYLQSAKPAGTTLH